MIPLENTMLVFIIFVFRGVSSDPCDPVFHQVLERSYHRGVACELTTVAENPVCDRRLKPGWYRASTNSGTLQMPSTCLQYACGTMFPIWLNGTHPQPEDGIVNMTGCQMISQCCDYTIPIKVKNCNGFFVYYLIQTSACPEGYCFGTDRCQVETNTSTTKEVITPSTDPTDGSSTSRMHPSTSAAAAASQPINPTDQTESRLCGSFELISFLALGLSFVFALTGIATLALAISKREVKPTLLTVIKIKIRIFPETLTPGNIPPDHPYEDLKVQLKS